MSDRYLKGVLTVIAFALCWIAGQLTVAGARADIVQAGVQQVQLIEPLVDVTGTKDRTASLNKYIPVYCVNCQDKKE